MSALTPEEFIARHNLFVQDLIERDLPLAMGAQAAHADQVTRIFIDGKNSAGGQIGVYNDTTPVYANPDTTPGKGFRPQGKVGNFEPRKKGSGTGDTFKNGKPRKTKWFPSYKALKQVIGQESEFVTLEYTGDLKSDFSNNFNPVKASTHEYQAGVRDHNADKKDGLEEKYGPVFAHTREEVAKFYEVAGKEYALLYKKIVTHA